MLRKKWLAAAAVVLVATTVGLAWPRDDYLLQVHMPTAAGTFVGARVTIAGQEVGKVTEVGVLGDKARVTVTVDDANAPMPSGTTARTNWSSVIGVRTVELLPGPDKNPDLPSGHAIPAKAERVELDDVLATLDAPTRKRLKSAVAGLRRATEGNEANLNETLKTAGPAVGALGEVLRGLGEDGPAIRALVANLHQLTSTLSNRRAELSGTVRNLSDLVGSAAGQQGQLKAAVGEVPSTAKAGSKMFGRVPAAVDAAAPLLRDLRPATERLPAIARDLRPVLTELRPTVDALRPTLASAQTVLRYTPDLLDSAHATVPGVRDAVGSARPAVSFLRPYTPEVIGFLSNWTSLFSGKNASGHFGRALVVESSTSVTDNPGVLPPGTELDPRPAPGSLAGQPWTDANGDGIR